jgi:putative PIN family toxin of toxin-antitoxin system
MRHSIGMPAPRLVLDTNAALDLWLFDDPRSAALGDAIARGAWQPVTNAACRDEWRRVLRYAAFALDEARIAELEARFDAICESVAATRDAPLPRCRDADDQKFLELARDARAACLVTRDAELLRLARRTQRDAGFTVATPENVPSRPTGSR